MHISFLFLCFLYYNSFRSQFQGFFHIKCIKKHTIGKKSFKKRPEAADRRLRERGTRVFPTLQNGKTGRIAPPGLTILFYCFFFLGTSATTAEPDSSITAAQRTRLLSSPVFGLAEPMCTSNCAVASPSLNRMVTG